MYKMRKKLEEMSEVPLTNESFFSSITNSSPLKA
jgi:hypothetical protein